MHTLEEILIENQKLRAENFDLKAREDMEFANLKSLVREYLKFPSLDGRIERQELRKKLKEVTKLT